MTYKPAGPQIALEENTPLAIGAEYTSAWFPRKYEAMIIAMKSDVNLDYFAEFSVDQTNIDSSVAYTYTAAEINLPRRLVIAREFFRVRVQNNSGITQTAFRMEVSEGAFPELQIRLDDTVNPKADATLSRAVLTGVDDNGVYRNASVDRLFNDRFGLKTSTLLRDKNGSYAAVSNFSELKTAEREIITEAKFFYNINTRSLKTLIVTTGSASVVSRQAILRTGTDSTGSCKVESVRTPSYIVSQEIQVSNTFVFEGVTGAIGSQVGPVDSSARIGIISTTDEISFGFINGSGFSIFIKRSGVLTVIPSSEFNRDKLDVNSTYIPDWTKLQLIRLTYSWHGSSPFVFQIEDDRGQWVTFHIKTFVNQTSLSSIGNPSLPLAAIVENTGSVVDNSLVWQAGQISIIGTDSRAAAARDFSQVNSKSIVASVLTPIFSIRSKATFIGLTNFINATLAKVSLATNGNKTVRFRLIKNGTLTGAVFSDVDAVNSVMEVSTAATAITGGTLEDFYPLAATDSYIQEVENLDIRINAGDTLTIAAFSTSTNDVDAAIRWREIH